MLLLDWKQSDSCTWITVTVISQRCKGVAGSLLPSSYWKPEGFPDHHCRTDEASANAIFRYVYSPKLYLTLKIKKKKNPPPSTLDVSYNTFSVAFVLQCTYTLFFLSDTLSVLARTIGKDVFSPLAAECIQLGLNLTDTIDDPDLRRCTYVT